MLRCGLAAVLFGATTPFASRLADDVNAPMLAGLLYLGAAVAVVPRVVSTPLPQHPRANADGPDQSPPPGSSAASRSR